MKELSNSAFLKRIKDTVKYYDMLREGDSVLVAVSGGSDSVCLLKALSDIKRQLGIEIMAGNIDHGLRGKESEKDSEFVKNLCGKFGVKCAHKKINVRRGGTLGASLEERAREKRYDFLVKTAVENKCGVIATGHTMDDQAETVLMRIIFGASFSGMCGIPPVREEKGIKIIRPLIRMDKKEILTFVNRNSTGYVEDSSNLDIRFLRNRIRREVLPYLEKINPMVKRTLANLSDTLREDLSFLENEKKKVLRTYTRNGKTGFNVQEIMTHPETIRKEIFKELFTRAGGNVKKLTYRHWMDMDFFIKTSYTNKSLDLPGKINAVRTKKEILFRKTKKDSFGRL
ncbi:MAG: tRNA lysidine(34) synthetase TilS [Candidatus Omnitrophota bacterium]